MALPTFGDGNDVIMAVDDVMKTFVGNEREVVAVDGVSLSIRRGETLGLIGESGSGKSTLGRLMLGLQRCDGGSIRFDGTDIAGLRARDLQRLRSRMTVVFQEPLESLNPRMRIGSTIEEPLRIHRPEMSGLDRRRKVDEALRKVALDPSMCDRSPSELSGGQQQRVSIARAIVTEPEFVVLDEPTSALDLSVQAQVLQLLYELQSDMGLSYLFISHDIDCIAYVSQRIAVMYLGRLLEIGPAESVLRRPLHPYTRSLLASSMSIDPGVKPAPLVMVGEQSSGERRRGGCVFWQRCAVRDDPRCEHERPPLFEVEPGHWVASFERSVTESLNSTA